MTASANMPGTLQRVFKQMVKAAPVAWRQDPLFRGASIGASITLAVLLLHLLGPHAPELNRPFLNYDPQTQTTRVSPPDATAPPQLTPPIAEVPKIAPGQPLGNATMVPMPSTDRFGTFTPGKRP